MIRPLQVEPRAHRGGSRGLQTPQDLPPFKTRIMGKEVADIGSSNAKERPLECDLASYIWRAKPNFNLNKM